MRTEPVAGRLARMTGNRVVLELEKGSEPIEGQVLRPDLPPKRFHGYMELIDALESARADDEERTGRSGALRS